MYRLVSEFGTEYGVFNSFDRAAEEADKVFEDPFWDGEAPDLFIEEGEERWKVQF